MQVLSIIESIAIIIASLGTFFTIYLSINAWRRERIGKRKLDLTQEVLALFYEARDAIKYIRHPFSFAGEGSTRNSGPNESPEEKQLNDNAHVVFERYNKRQDLFSKLYSLRYQYMSQFGKDSAKPFVELNKIVNDIFISAQMLPRYWKKQGQRQWEDEAEFQKHLDEMHKHEAVFWEMTPDSDQITPRVEAVIAEIETQSYKIIGKPE